MQTKHLRGLPCPDCQEFHPLSTRVCPDYREGYEDDDDEPTVEQLDAYIEHVYSSK